MLQSSWYPLLNGSGAIHLSFLPAPSMHSSALDPPLAHAAPRPSNPLSMAQSAPTLRKSQPTRVEADADTGSDEEQRPSIRHVATRLFRHEHVLGQRALSVYRPEEIVRDYPHIAKVRAAHAISPYKMAE